MTRFSLSVGPAAILCAAVLASLTDVSVAAARPFIKGPYLQQLATTSVDVRFEVDPPAPATVEFREPGKPVVKVTDREPKAFHSVTLSGLAPGTHYTYVVRALGFDSNPGEFTTAPPAGSTGPFSFALFGDDRSDDDAHVSVIRAIEGAPTDFLINTGDLVEDGSRPAAWNRFFAIEGILLRSRCLFACVGNHELHDDSAGTSFARYFGQTPSDKPAQLFGTMRWANARFFFLNPFQARDLVEGHEHDWLEEELKKSDAEPGLVWRFVVMHQGLWSSGPHGNSEYLIAAGFPDLFKTHKIDLVIAGHDHLYERGFQEGLRYVVSGGGGAPLYEIKHRVPGAKKVEPAYHWIQVDVAPEGVHMTAKSPNGTVLDSCNFSKAPGWLCDPAPPPPAPPKAKAPPPAVKAPEPSALAKLTQLLGCSVGVVGSATGSGAAPLAALLMAAVGRRRRSSLPPVAPARSRVCSRP